MQLILLNNKILQLGGGGALFSLLGGTGTPVPTALQITTSSNLPAGISASAYNFSFTGAGGTAPYSWALVSGSLAQGLSLSSAGILSGTPSNAEADTLVISLTDSASTTVQSTFSLTISSSVSNALNILTTSPLPVLTAGVSYSLTFVATGGSPPYTWSILSGAFPSELSLAPSTGVLSGLVHPESSAPFNAVMKVTDSAGAAATAAYQLTVANNSGIPNSPLLATATAGNGTVTVGATLSTTGATATSLTITSTDGTLSYVVGPTSTWTFTGLTNGKQYQFAVSANNLTGLSIPTLSNVVIPSVAGTPLTIVTGTLPSALINTAYSTTLSASGGTVPYTWTLASGTLPSGISVSSSGILSGTPTQVITDTNLVFKVTDAVSASATSNLTLVVAANNDGGTIPNAPIAVAASANTGTSAVISVVPDTSGGIATSYTASTVDGLHSTAALPLPLTVYGLTTGNAVQFYVTANNNTGVSARVLTNTITPLSTSTDLNITTTSIPSGTVGSSYTTTLSATGGSTPYTWSVSRGSLPAGLSLASTTGIISGTPTSVATAPLIITAVDSVGNADVQALSLVVSAATSTSLSISTSSSLPAAVVNTNYSTSLVASGGTSPYTWALASGTLPTGLLLSAAGSISGTPTAVGTTPSLVVSVTDSSGTGTSSYPVQVRIIDDEGANPGSTKFANGITYTDPGSLTAGQSILFFTTIATYSGGAGVSGQHSSETLTDTQGNSYTLLQSLSGVAGGAITQAQQTVMWWAQNVKGGSGNTWTSQFVGGDNDYQAMYGLVYTGATAIIGSSGLIQNNLSPGTNNVNSGTAISVASTDLPCYLVGFCFNLSQTGTGYTPTVGSGMTLVDTTWGFFEGTGDNVTVAYRQINAAGSYQAIFNQPSTAAESMQTLAVIIKGVPATSGATTSKTFSLVVNTAPLVLGTVSLPSVTVGTAYSTTLSASGGTVPYTWSVSSGSLPAGLALAASTGIISGTPTAAGSSSFSIKVTDSAGTVVVGSFTIAVAAAATTVPAAPTGVTASAGSGQATVSFVAPTSNGGAAITSYTVTSSPTGFSASGTASPITITGLSNGTAYTFTVKATNSAGTGVASVASAAVTPTAATGTLAAPSDLWVELQGQTAAGQSVQTSATNQFSAPSPNYQKLGWPAVSGADHYVIYRSTDNSTFSQYGTSTTTTFADTAATNCVGNTYGPTNGVYCAASTYWYKVAAVTSSGTIGTLSGTQKMYVYNYSKGGANVTTTNSGLAGGGYKWAGEFATGSTYNYTTGSETGECWHIVQSNGYILPYAGNIYITWNMWIGACKYLYMDIKRYSSGMTMSFHGEITGDLTMTFINLEPYVVGGTVTPNVWQTHKIPISVFMTPQSGSWSGSSSAIGVQQYSAYKFLIQANGGDTSATWDMDNVYYGP